MDFSTIPLAALPHPAVASAASVPSCKSLPLAQRLTLNPTITAKANYFDLAQTRRPPHDLRTALIWLCLAAHDNSVWWESRTPDHRDGEEMPPLPLKLNFAAWMAYVDQWAAETFSPHEDDGVEALALRTWIGAHETAVLPETTQKKTPVALPIGRSSTPTPSPEETRAGETTSSFACPLGPSTPPFTVGSPPTESRPSVPPSD